MLNSERHNHIQASQAMIEQILRHLKESLHTLLLVDSPSFPSHALPALPRLDTPTSALDSLKIVQTITASTDECFPPKPPIARKPYISTNTIALVNQLPHASSKELKPLRNKIKKSSKLDKNPGSPLTSMSIISVLLLNTGVPLKRYGTIQISTTYSVSQLSRRHSLHQIQESISTGSTP